MNYDAIYSQLHYRIIMVFIINFVNLIGLINVKLNEHFNIAHPRST